MRPPCFHPRHWESSLWWYRVWVHFAFMWGFLFLLFWWVTVELHYGEMRHREREMLCSARVAWEVVGNTRTRSLTHSITNIFGVYSVPCSIPGMEDSAESREDRVSDLMGIAGNTQGSKYVPYFSDSKMYPSPPLKNLCNQSGCILRLVVCLEIIFLFFSQWYIK